MSAAPQPAAKVPMKAFSIPRLLLWLAAALVALVAPASAEDIDVYASVSGTQDRPNVLFVLDNSSNWSAAIPGAANCYYRENGVLTLQGPADQGKKVAIQQCALNNLLDALPVNTAVADPANNALYNIGISLLNESSADGAYPRKAFTPLTSVNKAALKTLIKSLSRQGDNATKGEFAKALYEAYLYYKGSPPYRGMSGAKWDRAAVGAGRYLSPSANSCGRNYVILIANGSPSGSEDGDAKALLAAAGGDTAQITYPTSVVKSSDQANWADEFARFMRGADVSGKDAVQGIVTHTVAVVGAPSDGLYPNFIRSIANHGGGSYHSAADSDTLVRALMDIFNQIQAVDSVFASATLPVSVNARGTYLNQVYIGMFRPDADARPRWRGNLKQFRFGLDPLGALQLVDTNGQGAVSASTGFLSPSAQSFWTAGSSFWSNQPIGTPPSASDLPDGEAVEKGAAAQRLRTLYATSQAARRVYTCVGCADSTPLGGNAAAQFSSDNAAVTATALGVSGAAERAALIDWIRGSDNAGDEAGPSTNPATTVRPSIHGDVLHSRPAVLNYGGSIGVVAYYGANDGMLHAINGNQVGSNAGEPYWSFVPQELFGKLNRLRRNTPEVQLATTSPFANATPRDYFVDGPIGVYQKVNADGSTARAIIYVGLRRGGRAIYAIDVTNPAAPVFLWKRTPAELPQLAQTWSEPKVAQIAGNANPVLVFGAGYDAAVEDANSGAPSSIGNRIFVLDAITGVRLRDFATERSVAADVTLVDSDFDGRIDRAYAVDLGGQLWRIDFETSSGSGSASWTIYRVADLSGGTVTGRKFFFGPDAVVTRRFTALLFGSGDREKPLQTATVDHFFQLFDANLAKGPPSSHAPTVFGDLTAAGAVSSIAGRGCYVALAQGEKVVNAATTIGGSSYFGTHRPGAPASLTTCSANLGIGKSYAMPLFCVAPTGSILAGGGLPPSPVAGIVSIAQGSKSVRVPFIIGAPNPKSSGIEGSRVSPVIQAPRRRIYWYQENNR